MKVFSNSTQKHVLNLVGNHVKAGMLVGSGVTIHNVDADADLLQATPVLLPIHHSNLEMRQAARLQRMKPIGD